MHQSLSALLLRAALVLALCLAALAARAGPQDAEAPAVRPPMYLAVHIEGLLSCEKGAQNPRLPSANTIYSYCVREGQNAAAQIRQLLDGLEPGGARGQVQVGYVLTVPLLSLYRRNPKKATEWIVDDARLDTLLRLIGEIDRPVVVYLAANHFDSQGPIAAGLPKDNDSLMRFSNGEPAVLSYFGYRIMPYTLLTDADIAVNRYRDDALRLVAARLLALPPQAQQRIVAITLAGEVHHLFPDFTGGMGQFGDIRVTDYSDRSVAGFRQWLQQRHGSIARLNALAGTAYAGFDEVPAPARDIRRDKTASLAEHYDSYADGFLPVGGWLWDPQSRVEELALYINGQRHAAITRGFNRLDVYRSLDEVTDPNTGFRHDLDFSAMPPGRYLLQVIAHAGGKNFQIGRAELTVKSAADREETPPANASAELAAQPMEQLAGVRAWLDMPASGLDVYFNPLAREWNAWREWQVRQWLRHFHQVALQAGLPADRLYSHQVLPRVNSSWNSTLFASDGSLDGALPWQTGVNLYGGAAHSAWVQQYLQQHGIRRYGVPEFNPQQWKTPGVHLEAMRHHYDDGAVFISPYHFNILPRRLNEAEHGVNAMELAPDNPRDGSAQFYEAIRAFAAR